jgi:Protein of unknown function (DUF2442)
MNTFMPRVLAAEYRGNYQIHLTFNDGVAGTVDFSRWLRGPVFEPLKDPNYFQRFIVGFETLEWPNQADVAPETLYEAAQAAEKTARKTAVARKPAAKKPSDR